MVKLRPAKLHDTPTEDALPLPPLDKNSFRLALTCVAIVLVAGAGVRLTHLGAPSLWLDEILQLRCTTRPLSVIWDCSPANKPPLDYYIQALLVGARPSEAMARAHAVVFGVGYLAAAAWLAWRLGGASFAFAALLAMALSPVHIRFSQEGRPYALMMFAEALFLIALWELTHNRRWERWRAWLALAGAIALALWAFYANLIAIFISFLAMALWILIQPVARREFLAALASRRTWLFLGEALIIVIVALLPLALRTMQRFDPAHRNHWGGWSVPLMLNYLDIFACGYDWYHYRDESVWLAALFAAAGVFGGLLRRDTRHVVYFSVFLFAGAYWGTFAIYAAMDQYLEMRYTLTAFLPFSFLVGLGIWTVGCRAAGLISRWRGQPQSSTGLTMLLTLAAALPWLAFQGHFLAERWVTRTDWRGLAQRIESQAAPESVVIVGDFLDDITLRYYFDHYQIRTPIFISDYDPAQAAHLITTGRDVWIVVRENAAPPAFWEPLPEVAPDDYFLLEVRRYNTMENSGE